LLNKKKKSHSKLSI